VASIYLKDICCKTRPHVVLVNSPWGMTWRRVKSTHNTDAGEAFDEVSPVM